MDNEISWFDWNLCKPNSELLRFAKGIIQIRLRFDQGTTGIPVALEKYLRDAHIEWHGTKLHHPDWGYDSHSVAVSLHNHALNQVRYIAINSFWKPLEFELPTFADASSRWMRMIDTSLRSPSDIAKVGEGSEIDVPTYVVNPHSIIMLHHVFPESK